MQAMLPNLTQNKTKYKLLDDNKAGNLILAIFNLIKDEKDFSDNAMENYIVAIQSEKEAIITNGWDVNIAKTTQNMKQLFNCKMGIQGNNVMNNNNFNNDMIQQNLNTKNNKNQNNSWLKFVLAAIFASGAIVAVIFEFYILAAIALAVALLALFGKLIFSRCFGCCRSQNYNSVPMNEESQRISQYYGQNCPNLENQYDQY